MNDIYIEEKVLNDNIFKMQEGFHFMNDVFNVINCFFKLAYPNEYANLLTLIYQEHLSRTKLSFFKSMSQIINSKHESNKNDNEKIMHEIIKIYEQLKSECICLNGISNVICSLHSSIETIKKMQIDTLTNLLLPKLIHILEGIIKTPKYWISMYLIFNEEKTNQILEQINKIYPKNQITIQSIQHEMYQLTQKIKIPMSNNQNKKKKENYYAKFLPANDTEEQKLKNELWLFEQTYTTNLLKHILSDDKTVEHYSKLKYLCKTCISMNHNFFDEMEFKMDLVKFSHEMQSFFGAWK